MTAPTYVIDFTDSTVDSTKTRFSILPGELNTSTSLKLPGAGFASYGEFVDEDLLHLLEHFASGTAPNNPTIGQIWYDTSIKRLKILSAISGTTSAPVYTWDMVSNNTAFSSTAPTDLTLLWYDTSDTNPVNHVLKIYNTTSASWQPVVAKAMVVSTTAPASQQQLWYNTSSSNAALQELYAYNPATLSWRAAASHDASLLTGVIPSSVLANSNIGGNAATATLADAAKKLQTARGITLTGGATGTTMFDGSADVTIPVTALNASVLSSGTIPVARLGSAGTRAAGYYLGGDNVWVAMPTIIDSYSKTQTDTLLATKLNTTGTAASAANVNGYTATDIINAAYAKVGTMGKRDLYVSTGAPAAGNGVAGDVWFQY